MPPVTPIRQSGAALPPGTMLGHYRIEKKLGQGGFGITYLAVDTDSGTTVVIKENLPTFCSYRDVRSLHIVPTGSEESMRSHAKMLTRFLEEARTLARLNHPNIVRVTEAFEVYGTAYYVMPWVGGQDLYNAAPEPQQVNEAWLLPLLRSLLQALDYLHGRKLLHRDIKPGNILVQTDGTPILIDFGTARELDNEHSRTLVGTPGYTPLEQITTHGKLGAWTDLYSLGATCYRLITGQRPPDAPDRLPDDDTMQPLSVQADLLKRYSWRFLQSVDKALSMRAQNRWQTAAEWLAALEPMTANAPHAAGKSHKLFYSLSVGCVLLAGAAGGVLFFDHTPTQEKETAPPAVTTETPTPVEPEPRKPQITPEHAQELAGDFCAAAAAGNLPELQRLLAEGASANMLPNGKTEPALYLAAANGHTECVKFLLSVPDVNLNYRITNKTAQTALAAAVCGNHPDCVRILLTAPGMKLDGPGCITNALPGHLQEYGKIRECVRLVLAAPGMNVNNAENLGEALTVAVANSCTPYVEDLLSIPGINVNARDTYPGKTPLIMAVEKGNEQIFRLLLNAPGLDINATSADGNTALHTAAQQGSRFVEDLLQVPGISVNARNNEGKTPLDEVGNEEDATRALLVAAGAQKANDAAPPAAPLAPDSLEGGSLSFVASGYGRERLDFGPGNRCYCLSAHDRMATYTYTPHGSEAAFSVSYHYEVGRNQKVYEYTLTDASYEPQEEEKITPGSHPAKLTFTQQHGKVWHGYVEGRFVCTNHGGYGPTLQRVPFRLIFEKSE